MQGKGRTRHSVLLNLIPARPAAPWMLLPALLVDVCPTGQAPVTCNLPSQPQLLGYYGKGLGQHLRWLPQYPWVGPICPLELVSESFIIVQLELNRNVKDLDKRIICTSLVIFFQSNNILQQSSKNQNVSLVCYSKTLVLKIVWMFNYFFVH